MKQFIIALTTIFFLYHSNAQYVGIGTTSPLYRLHVDSGDAFINTQNGSFKLGAPASSQWRIRTLNNSADLSFQSASYGAAFNPLHLFKQNGNVGIGLGSSNPISRLDVMGTGTTAATNTFTLRSSTGDTLLRLRDDGRMGIGYNGPSYGRTFNLGGTGINFYTANEAAFGGAVFPTDTSLVIWSNTSANKYVVLQPEWGATGVGTYSPNAKFHVNGTQLIGGNAARTATGYALSVTGKVMATEFTTLAVASWPDYVFEQHYKLMSLEQLAAFIKLNKHLPNIPSAAKVEKDGINLGEMNKKLIEKVEELTLYVIELNNRIKTLEEKAE